MEVDGTMNRETPALLSVTQAREALGGVSVATFYNLVNDGDLALVKIRGRTFVRREDIDALIERSVEHRGEAA